MNEPEKSGSGIPNDGSLPAPEEPKREDGSGEGRPSLMTADAGRRKRLALIFVLILLILALVLIPLSYSLLHRSASTGILPGADKGIVYCRADFETDIWKDEEYTAARTVKEVRATVRDYGYVRGFFDRESAVLAFEGLSELPDGGGTLGTYFLSLLLGSDQCPEGRFENLFSPSYSGRIPKRFPAQKIVYLRLTFLSENAEAGLFEWRADFSILNNDGLAVDYLDTRDTGSARFCLLFENGEYRISEIHTIVRMN